MLLFRNKLGKKKKWDSGLDQNQERTDGPGVFLVRISPMLVHQRSVMLFWTLYLLKMEEIEGNSWKANL